MAATAWAFYNKAKKKLGDGTIDLDAGIYKMVLCTSASNASVATLDKYGSITGNIVAQGGYVSGGRIITGVTWTSAGDPSSVKWDATDLVFTASGANLSAIKYAVIRNSTSAANGHLMVWSKLSTAAFSVTSGNTLTIQFAAAGIFTLT